jgi:peptide deformylase
MAKIELKIKVFGDLVLRKKAKTVARVTGQARDILSQMARLMYDASGIGLAAPQIGISESMIVVDIGSGLYKLINPRIAKRQGQQVLEEGCLSVPGVCIKVKRARRVVVKALDENGKDLAIEAEGLLACVFQHEIDHLKGKLIVDYASLIDKIKIRRKLAELAKKAEDEKLSEPGTKSCTLQL